MVNAGDIIRASDVTTFSDEATLSNDTASTTNTWEDWGTETITFTDPDRDVQVLAWMSGQAVNGTDANTQARLRVAISLDGGSTFTQGNDPISAVGTDHATRQVIACMHQTSGTPTGDIVIKGQLNTTDTTTAFQSGLIMARMAPA